MDSPTAGMLAFGAAAVVSAAGVGMESAGIRYGAEAVAMLALAVSATMTGRHRGLRFFGLLLAGAALADLASEWLPYPDPLPDRPVGCPGSSAAFTDYWTSRLRLVQLAAALRCGAMICVVPALAALPIRSGLRPWHRPALIILAAIPAVLVGLQPIYAAEDRAELLYPTSPATLLLAAAATVTVLTVTRAAGGRIRTTALIGGGVLTLLSVLSAVEKVAVPFGQTRYQPPEPQPGVLFSCFYTYGTPATPLATVVLAAGGQLLVLAGAALLVWAAAPRRFSRPR